MKKVLDLKLKRMKYMLGMFLTLLIMLSLSISVCAFSANRNEQDFAISKVKATSIMIGTDKGFEGEKELTRAEAITIITRMKGLREDQIEAFRSKDGEELVFSDVTKDYWANPYINAAFNLELTEGVGDGKFNPSSPVTVSEVYTMAIRSLGADKLVLAEKKDGEEWFVPYLNFANDHHISDNVNKLFSNVCDRNTCAMIVSNTLDKFLWESSKVTSGNSHKELPEVTFTESSERLIDKLGFKEFKEITITEVDTKDKKIRTSERVNGKNNLDGSSLLDMISNPIKRGIKYTLWLDDRSGSTDKGKLTGYFEELSSSDVVYFKDIKKIGTNYITVLERNKEDRKEDKEETNNKENDKTGKELKLNTLMMRDDPSKFGFDLYYNDIKQTNYTKLSEDSSLSGYLIKDKDGKISKMYIEDFNYFGVIKELTDKKITFETKNKVKGSITETISLSEDNEVIFTDLKPGDGVMFHKESRSDLYSGSSKGTRYTIRKLNARSGRIKSVSTETRTTGGIKVQSVTLLGDYENGIWKLDARIDGYKVSPGDEGVFFLNDKEEIILFTPYEASKGDYVFINATRLLRPVYVGDDYGVEVKVTTMDGKTSDWLELDIEESAINLLGLKEWTLTEEIANKGYEEDYPDLESWIVHKSSDWTLDDETWTNIYNEYYSYLNFTKKGDPKLYVLDRWLWDPEVGYQVYPDYSVNGFYFLPYNYYIFEERSQAKGAAESILRSFISDEITSDTSSLSHFLTGKPFKASIRGNEITLNSFINDYEEEWVNQDSPTSNWPTSNIKLISSFTNGKKYDTVKDLNDNTYYLADDAKVFLASWNGESGLDLEIKLRETNKDDLESISSDNFYDPICEENIDGTSSLFAFALGADDDEREVSFIIIPEGRVSKKTETELWAVLLETGSSIYDKEECQSDNENIDSFAEVVFEGSNKIRTLYFENSKFTGSTKLNAKLNGDDVFLPAIYKFDIEGNEIKRARANNTWDTNNYFSSSEEGDPGLISEFQGVITGIISETRIKIKDAADYIFPVLNTNAYFTSDEEHYFLSDKLIIVSKEEGTDSYTILDSIYDLKETSLDLETVPTTQEQLDNLLSETNEKLDDEIYRFITFNKEGDIEILAIIKE